MTKVLYYFICSLFGIAGLLLLLYAQSLAFLWVGMLLIFFSAFGFANSSISGEAEAK